MPNDSRVSKSADVITSLDWGLIRSQMKVAFPFGHCIFKSIPASDHEGQVVGNAFWK